MRKVNRDHILKPVELDSAECQGHLNQVIANGTIKVSPDFYKGKRVDLNGVVTYTVKESLKSLYKNKCAYCEKLSHKPKIDHHRPKGKVIGGGNINRGYYWLCYEWTNLLPSCTDCNSIEAKNSYYPLSGARNNSHPLQGLPPVTHHPSFAYTSAYNISEQPLLLHPEYCEPEAHFDFERTGKIIGIGPQGIETVRVLKLDNEDLNGWRRKIYEAHQASLERLIKRRFRLENPLSENQFGDQILEWTENIVQEANNDASDYTLFRKTLIRKVNYFFIDTLDPLFQTETRLKITEALDIIAT